MKTLITAFALLLSAATASAGTPEQDADAERRSHVRGCPLETDCRSPEDAMREFEFETFGDSSSPWATSKADSPTRAAVDPLTLRPDLPWLAEIKNLPDLPVVWNHRIIKYLEFYRDDRRGQNIIRGWLKAQGKYKDYLSDKLEAAGLPQDLIYVAMIESSYNPMTKSYAGAAGLWQFMPFGGRIYGLSIDRWVDERYDPIRSTEAAMLYWKDLHARFGNWELALAAYNGGYGAVLRAIAKYNTNDYWKLADYENALPWGTQNYVAKALATAIVGHNPEVFGNVDVVAEAPILFDSVTVKKPTSVSAIARAAGVKSDDIKALNPHLRRSKTPPVDGRYRVYIPAGTVEQFAKRFPQEMAEEKPVEVYVVKHGERFEDIATTHGVSRYKLRKMNGVSHESEVGGGTPLVVPAVAITEKAENQQKADENLYTSGVPGGKSGEPLIVSVPDKDFHIDGTRRVFYRVVAGDSLWGISRAFGVSPGKLANWNGLDPESHIHPRMIMQVFVNPNLDFEKAGIKVLDETRVIVLSTGSEEHLSISEHRTGRKRSEYTAKKAEKLGDIGKRFGLTARDLARINKISPSSTVEKGQTIIVYEVVDQSRSKRAAKQSKRLRKQKRRKKK